MNKDQQKHFKVVYGKVLGIPVGSAEPISPEGKRIFIRYFAPFLIAIFLGIFVTKIIGSSRNQALFFMLCWCIAALSTYLFIRQLKHTAIFERQYFFKHDKE